MRDDIDRLLREWLPAGGSVLYYPNPGNAGDALIATATWQAFDRLGVNPRPCRPERGIPPGSHVILGGGGNLVPLYTHMARALQACRDGGVRRCLLLPHTIRGHEPLLASLDERFTLLARDLITLGHVRRHAPRARIGLADDLVLGLDVGALKRRTRSLPHRFGLLADRRWWKRRGRWRQALARQRPDAVGRLEILRGDLEASVGTGETRAPDLMAHFVTMSVGRAACDQVSMDVVRLLGSARSIRTDRLHVALPAALLGLPVEMLDNNYGKLGAVWETSLRGRFANVSLTAAAARD